MIEYIAVLGGGLRDAWAGQLLPLLAMIRSSPYFWPGVVAAVLAFILVTRQISR